MGRFQDRAASWRVFHEDSVAEQVFLMATSPRASTDRQQDLINLPTKLRRRLDDRLGYQNQIAELMGRIDFYFHTEQRKRLDKCRFALRKNIRGIDAEHAKAVVDVFSHTTEFPRRESTRRDYFWAQLNDPYQEDRNPDRTFDETEDFWSDFEQFEFMVRDERATAEDSFSRGIASDFNLSDQTKDKIRSPFGIKPSSSNEQIRLTALKPTEVEAGSVEDEVCRQLSNRTVAWGAGVQGTVKGIRELAREARAENILLKEFESQPQRQSFRSFTSNLMARSLDLLRGPRYYQGRKLLDEFGIPSPPPDDGIDVLVLEEIYALLVMAEDRQRAENRNKQAKRQGLQTEKYSNQNMDVIFGSAAPAVAVVGFASLLFGCGYDHLVLSSNFRVGKMRKLRKALREAQPSSEPAPDGTIRAEDPLPVGHADQGRDHVRPASFPARVVHEATFQSS